MRLGKKKEKDKEAEIRSVDGIIRLICLSKGQAPLKGWLNIKLIIERISDGFVGWLSVWILEDPPRVNVMGQMLNIKLCFLSFFLSYLMIFESGFET